MKRLLSFVLALLPIVAFAYRDRPPVEDSSFSPITVLGLMVIGGGLLVLIGRVVFECLKEIDWEGLFKGIFSFICIGALIWMVVLFILSHS